MSERTKQKDGDLTYDRTVMLSVGDSRKTLQWKQQAVTLGALYARLESPVIGMETIEEYLRLPKGQQDSLKDVGGFVGGGLMDGRRKAGHVAGRDVVTLDFDHVPPYGTDDILKTLEELRCGYAVYSTRKHRPEAPRLRVLFPLDRTVSADEYEPVARYLADQIGIEMADPTTFEAWRLMYWPSVCAGAEYVFRYVDAPPVDADSVLGTYTDWRDLSGWPQVPGADPRRRMAAKQGDPESKPGIVGAFNRACGGVIGAMDKFLPGLYVQTDTDPDRYTYAGGSTTGGAVIYDNGKFLYSHHATDPCSGRLVNAFDLVRLHKFGDMDADAKADTPVNRLPSYTAMCNFAASDPETAAVLTKDRMEQAKADWEGLDQKPEEDPENWLDTAGLRMNPKTGHPLPTINNVIKILKYDPALRDRIGYNAFAGYITVTGALPWNPETARRRWTDTDLNGLYFYLETMFDITKRTHIDSALDVYSAERSFHPLQDYLRGLEWDGTPRVDRLFVDYLGAEDDEYTRTVTRKIMVAAVARAMRPGCKFDNMLVLCGTQGRGKSSILSRLAKGWFNDSILTFEGKDAAELIQGVWIVEIAELNAMRKSDVSRVKQFLSLQTDRFRPAYGRNVKEVPRSCVFFGTVNDRDFLDDLTGNRRFWPVDVDVQSASKEVWRDLTDAEVDQIWAEAYVRWQVGEKLYLTKEQEAEAARRQEMHRDTPPMEGLIMDFIDRPVPSDWESWPVERRRDFWSGLVKAEDMQLTERTRVCALEVWTELYGGDRRTGSSSVEYRKIKAMLRKILSEREGEKWTEKRMRYGGYGTQRVFEKQL